SRAPSGHGDDEHLPARPDEGLGRGPDGGRPLQQYQRLRPRPDPPRADQGREDRALAAAGRRGESFGSQHPDHQPDQGRRPGPYSRPRRRRVNAWSLTAEADEDLVTLFIQGCDMFDVRQAGRYPDGLEEVFPRLAANTEMARLRLEFDPPVRVFNFKTHVILSEVDHEVARILWVRHGHDDWSSDPLGDDEQ